jgi:mono/diheme cytochrome c family protein
MLRRSAPLVVFAAVLLGAAAKPRDVTEGRVLYTRYCGACHGTDADGHGPVAAVLRAAPSDLRRLGARWGRPLPVARIAEFVDGRATVAAHGPREMPVWGERFRAPEQAVDPRIARIVAYLDTIQIAADRQ